MLIKNKITFIKCKHCGSPQVIKFGTRNDIQRYYCKDCERKFVLDTLPKMKTPMTWIASALDMYYRGMPLDSIQGHMKLVYGKYFSEAGIYKWIVRFTKEAIKKSEDFKPVVGGKWIGDETAINAGGRKVWFWDIIDAKTRFLLASHISKTRRTEDAQVLVEKAIQRAGKVPDTIITDKLRSYIDGIELANNKIKHIRSKPFTEENHTNFIERFHGTMKERTNVIRNFNNLRTARLLTDGWLIQYNYFKEHESLGNISPAKRMKVALPFKDWNDIVRTSGEDKYVVEAEHLPIAQPTTERQKKSAYIRKVVRKSQAKKKSLPKMGIIKG